MKSAIIIDFAAYQEHQDTLSEVPNDKIVCCSDELALAIQTLILQMRKTNPLKQTG